MPAQYVEVAFPLPLDSTYTYEIPSELGQVYPGHRVLVPFGSRILTGYVFKETGTVGEIQPKLVQAVLDEIPLLAPSTLALVSHLSKLYGVSLGEALWVALPPGLARQSRKRIMATQKEGEPTNSQECEFLSRLRKGKGLDYITALRRRPGILKVIRRLEKEGWVALESTIRCERAREPKKKTTRIEAKSAAPSFALSVEQTKALLHIEEAMDRHAYKAFLLHGITGSGKTEIYLRSTAHALSQGKTVLALVPEIALTPQFVERFRFRFGDLVAVLHSGKSAGERFSEWKRIRKGEATVVIGARSAIFAPLENVGLMILDEEHDASYKQDEGLAYHARDLARYRAHHEKAVLVLGSATPSLETYEATRRKEIELLELPSRVTGADLPTVKIVDLRGEISKFGEKGFISSELREAMTLALEKNEQVVLFLNRRGFATLILCPRCGEGLRCSDCSISLTYHRKENKFLCHYCGACLSVDTPCSSCKIGKFVLLGVGTERVEQELRNYFPDVAIARMDRDAVQGKGKFEKILKDLEERKTDILIGTQMVTKGLDLAHVSLVGVLLADQSLHFPDFRAAERTFQLLTQVVGRSGRGSTQGLAIIQTFQPEHYAIVASASQRYQPFFEREIEVRRQAGYPPFGSLALIELHGLDRDSVRSSALWLGKQALLIFKKRNDKLTLLGPAPAPLEKLRGRSRYHLLLRSSEKTHAYTFAQWLAREAREVTAKRGVAIRVDVDPYQFL